MVCVLGRSSLRVRQAVQAEVRDVSRDLSDVTALCELLTADGDGVPDVREVRAVTEAGRQLQDRSGADGAGGRGAG